MTKCYSHFLPLTQIAAATFAQSWATFTKNILEKQSDKSFSFLIYRKLDLYRKIYGNTFLYDFIAILENNFPIDTGIEI